MSLHRYLYAYANPTTYIDLHGYEAQTLNEPGLWDKVKNYADEKWDEVKDFALDRQWPTEPRFVKPPPARQPVVPGCRGPCEMQPELQALPEPERPSPQWQNEVARGVQEIAIGNTIGKAVAPVMGLIGKMSGAVKNGLGLGKNVITAESASGPGIVPNRTAVPVQKSVAAEPDTRTISIFGFRGQGNPKIDLEGPNAPNPLSVTGHVGMSTDGGTKVIAGFNPDAPSGMTASEVVGSLLKGKSYDGLLSNDRRIFSNAASRTGQARGGSPNVYKMDIQVSREKFEEIEKFISQNLNIPMANRPYAFPGHGGPCARNCATFPESLGVPIPENSGQIRAYIDAMEKQGAEIWKAK